MWIHHNLLNLWVDTYIDSVFTLIIVPSIEEQVIDKYT